MSNTLVAEERKVSRKSVLSQLRNRGNIPAVVYGKHEESKSIAVKNVDLLKIIREVGRNGIISLDVNGNTEDVILADFQSNPINHDITHADFLHIDKTTKMHAQVHVALTGNAKGVEDGGILQQSLHELHITAKPTDIPEAIDIDISNLQINHTVKVGDIRKNYSNVTINHEDEEAIVSILPARQEEEDDATEQQSSSAEVSASQE